MDNTDSDLAKTLRQIKTLLRRAKTLAEPILQRWATEAKISIKGKQDSVP